MVIPEKYPGTHVLVNKFEISDFKDFELAESAATVRRQYEIDEGTAGLGNIGVFDKKFLKNLHRYLFQDVYDWAGEFRGHELRKDFQDQFVPQEDIDKELDRLFEKIDSDDCLVNASKAEFVTGMAEYLGLLGVIHPFSEGNGRAQRAFLIQLARNSGYRINFKKVPDWQSVVSAQRFHRERVLEPLEILIETALVN